MDNNMNYMYGQQFYGNNMGNYYPGMPIQQNVVPQPQNKPSLTPEEIKMIQNVNPDKFDITISPTDNLRAICNHKDSNGTDRVIQLTDGSGDVWCPLCQWRWDPYNATKEEAKEIVDRLIALMQNAKWVGDYGINLIRDYFPMIPLLEKFPDLYEVAMKQFNKYCNNSGYTNANDAAIYSTYNSIMGFGGVQQYAPQGGGYQYGFMQQPNGGMMYGNQPQGVNQYGSMQQPIGGMTQYSGANPTVNPMQVGQPQYGVANGGMMYGNQPQYGVPNGGMMYGNQAQMGQMAPTPGVGTGAPNGGNSQTPNYAPASQDNNGQAKNETTVNL